MIGGICAVSLGLEVIGSAWCWALGIGTGPGESRALVMVQHLTDVSPRGFWGTRRKQRGGA